MATIKLPQRQMMNQNVRPAQLSGNSSVGDAYKAVGKAAQNLGAKAIAHGQQQQKLIDEGWVLKKRRQMKEEYTQATMDHRDMMDATTGMMNVENKDGTVSVGKESYEDTQKQWLDTKYGEFKDEAPSDVAWALFEQRHAPNLLAGIDNDKSHVKKERLDGFEVTIHDNQDSRAASIPQHDPEASGVSLLQHTVEMSKEHDDELLDMAQEGFGAKRYNKMNERGNTTIIGSYFEVSLDNKDYGGVAIGGGYLQPGFEKSTLQHLNSVAESQLGGKHNFRVDRKKVGGNTMAEIVTGEGANKKQFNLSTGMLEPYDGKTASVEPDPPLINRLKSGEHLEIYGRLMKGLGVKATGHGSMVTDMMAQTKSMIFGNSGFDVGGEDGVARRAELHLQNDTDMVTPQWKKDRNSAEIDGMFIIGTAKKSMATESPALFAKNWGDIDAKLKEMSKDNPFIGKVQLDSMKAEILRQRAQMVNDMNTDGASHLLKYSDKAKALFSATNDPDISDAERTAAWHKYGNFVNDKLEEMGVSEANRQTMPDAIIKKKFDALQQSMMGLDGTDHKVNENAVIAARDIFKYLSREESARMMNKYGKSLNEPRIAIIAKMSDTMAASKVLNSVTTDKLNKKNGVDGISKKNKGKIHDAVHSESGTTELLQKTLEMEGGGLALQNSYVSLIKTHAEHIMASTGVSPTEAVQQATTDIMGEYDVKTYGGHYSKNTYSIPKSHIKEGGWSEKQIQESVDIIQNPVFLENNVDMGATLGNVHKNHVNLVFKLNKFKHESYKELIEMKMTRAMFNPESQYVFGKDPINVKRLKSWAKKNEVSYEEAERMYKKMDIQAMELPKIEGQYIAEEKRFAPVMRMKNGKTRRVKAREGAEYNRNGLISVSPHDTGRFGIPQGGGEEDRKIPGLGSNRAMRGKVDPTIEEVGN